MLSVFLIAVSLAMDAFAVSVSNGISTRNFCIRNALIMGLYFGAFQFSMPLIGWILGQRLSRYAASYGHLVAFVLLAFIGVRMIAESVCSSGREQEEPSSGVLSHGKLVALAVATSIDALVVGVSMAFIHINIMLSAVLIGVVAFALSVFGGLLGRRLGRLFQKRAEIAGGLILIIIGLRLALTNSAV